MRCDTVPMRSRSYGKGVSDGRLFGGKLADTVGGNCPVTDTVVVISKAK